jgi:hypothetical protein
VLHDAIAVLANEPGFSPNTQLIQSIVSLANVSSVLEHDHPTYISADRPIDAAPPPDGMTSAYFSFRHELDPIANTKTFRGDLNGWPSSGYLDEVPIDVKDWNVHGYTHYLDNPLAHLRLFERLWPREPWRDRRDDAVRKYKAAPGTSCPVAIAQARLELRKLFSHPMPTDPIGFLDVVARTVVVLDDARQACQRETP